MTEKQKETIETLDMMGKGSDYLLLLVFMIYTLTHELEYPWDGIVFGLITLSIVLTAIRWVLGRKYKKEQ